MRILCYGAGAVGSLVGGRLSLAGHEVTLLARPQRATALQEHGVTLRLPRGATRRAHPKVITSVGEACQGGSFPDLIIVAVKGYDTAGIAPEVARACGPLTNVLSLQNGVGNEECLAATVGAERVIAGSFTLSVALEEAGQVVQHTTSGGVALAEMEVSSGERLGSIASAFSQGGLRVRLCANWRAMKWSKLLLNILTNASCAILGFSPAEVFADARLFRLEQQAFREALEVMRRLGLRPVNLPGYPVRWLCGAMRFPACVARPILAKRVARGRGHKHPSLALDLAQGRGRSEVDFLNGAVVRAAMELGMSAPANALLASTLAAILQGDRGVAEFHRRPEALLAGFPSSER